jgi:putative ABC transport system substrate-binding protein
VKNVAIITMNDTPQLLEVKDGLMAGLASHGYTEGKNLNVNFKSAQGNFGTAQQIVRQFIGENPDVIVTITTPTSQAAIAATKDIPIIFTTVTDPLKSKLVTQEKHPGGNASGISDLVPAERQLDVVKEIVPNLKTLGLVYDPGLDNARSTVESIRRLRRGMGFTIAGRPRHLNVPSAGQALVGEVVRSSCRTTPRFTAPLNRCEGAQDAKVRSYRRARSVQRGAVVTVGFDFRTWACARPMVDGRSGASPATWMSVHERLRLCTSSTRTGREMGVNRGSPGGARLRQHGPPGFDLIRESLRCRRP